MLDEWDISHRGLRRLSAADIKAFWTGYGDVRQRDLPLEPGSLYSRWVHLADDLVLSLYVTNRSVGLFVRGQRGESYATTARRFNAYEPQLGIELDALPWTEGLCYLSNHRVGMTDRNCWPRAYNWLTQREARFRAVISRMVLGL